MCLRPAVSLTRRRQATHTYPALAPEPRRAAVVSLTIGTAQQGGEKKNPSLLPGSRMTFSPRLVERDPSPSQEQIIPMRRSGCCGRPSGMYRGDAASTFQRLVHQADEKVCIVSDSDSAAIRTEPPGSCPISSDRSALVVHFACSFAFRSSC